MTYTKEEVAKHIRRSDTVEWTNLARVLVDGVQSCVDGREPHAVLGTPGGDAGEYLVHLAAIEKLTGRQLSDDEIPEVFARFLDHFGRFYMHTDTHALANLGKALAADPDFGDVGTKPDKVAALVRKPGKRADKLIPHLLEPNHVGCGHLKLILLHPEQYGVRVGLTRRVLETVFRSLWAGADINYTVLEGKHAEGAVVQVSAGKRKHAYTRVPMVAPCREHTQMFVHHPKVAAWLRTEMASFLVEEEPLLEGVETDAFVKAVNDLANGQLGATLGHLASGLPVYQALVNDAGSVVVTGDTVVG